jgi:hypothetical protein
VIGLQDFVKETLVQITTGVKQAQEALDASDGEINPLARGSIGSIPGTYPISHRRLAHHIELDIAVVADEKRGVVVAPASKTDAGCVSRIRFKIGVAFPVTEKEEPAPSEKASSELEV